MVHYSHFRGNELLYRIMGKKITIIMNKKLSSMVLAIMVAGSCFADDVPALKITKTDSESAVSLSELLSIKFTESDMVVNMKDGTRKVVALDDIIVMELGETSPTDISSIFADSDINAVCTVIDINGKVIAKGKLTDSNLLPAKKGVYVITVGERSKKVLVK